MRKVKTGKPITHIKCNSCPLILSIENAQEGFNRHYRKIKNPSNYRSSWQSICRLCRKAADKIIHSTEEFKAKNRISKNKQYHANIDLGRKRTNASYYRNKKAILARNLEKRLHTTNDKDALLKRRWVHGLNEKDKFIYDKYKEWFGGSKSRNIAFLVSYEDILSILKGQDEKCFYTDIPLSFERNKHETISLDRIDSLKDYTLENCVICCTVINLMKLDTPLQEFFDWCTKVVRYNG